MFSHRLKHIKHIVRYSSSRQFGSVIRGARYTPNFSQYLQMANGEIGSYFHDIPLGLNGNTVTMLVEIPRWSNAKFEISKTIPFNPITQDIKKGQVRFVNNIFPFKGYIHNYGAIPQTWESPLHKYEEDDANPDLKGDNDPLDCCEIGSAVLPTGSIRNVKILGSLGLIDDGELDWKVIVIDHADPLATKINSLDDVDKYMPKLLDYTREWFRNYKIPQGNPSNKFAFNEQYKSLDETIDIIKNCHDSWKCLMKGKYENATVELPTISTAGTGVKLSSDIQPDAKIPETIDKWYYV